MPRIISFAFTSSALINGLKTVTRRSWKDEYAARFHAGDEILAYDYSPRSGKGVSIARLRLTHDPVKESWADAPDSDWEGEGFHYLWAVECGGYQKSLGKHFGAYLSQVATAAWARMKCEAGEAWVVRFELLELLPGAEAYRDGRGEIPLARLEKA